MRAEFTIGNADATTNEKQFNLLRVIPGIAMLVRPNIRVVVAGDIDSATGTPPSGSWGAAGGAIAPTSGGKLQAETVTATAAVAF